jgi:hypothetical protein
MSKVLDYIGYILLLTGAVFLLSTPVKRMEMVNEINNVISTLGQIGK